MKKMILFLGIALFVLYGCKEKAPVTVGEGSIVVDITQPEKNLKMLFINFIMVKQMY